MSISAYVEAADPSTPNGKTWNHVDLSTLQQIEGLFPAPTLGQTFVVRFAERAVIERLLIPNVREGDVVVCAKSIAQLGEKLGLSNDTTNKYVLLFKALGLLEKRKVSGQLAFVLSLGIYHPPDALEANLDSLIARSQARKSRSKFHQLAVEVKQRCRVYGLISQDFNCSLQQLHVLTQVDSQHRLSKRQLERRLTQAQHLVSTMMTQVFTEHLPKVGSWVDSPQCRASAHRINGEKKEVAQKRGHVLESTQFDGRNTSDEAGLSPNLPESSSQISVMQHERNDTSTQNPPLGGHLQSRVSSNPPISESRVDAEQQDRNAKSPQSEQSGRFPVDTPPSRLPEASEKVDSNSLSNVNVRNIITDTLNVNVGIVAALMCRIFGEQPSKQGIYRKLFTHEGCDQPEAVSAAVIYSLVHFHRDGTIHNPASFFINRCKEYHRNGIPEESTDLLRQYGQLTHQQFLDEMRQPAPRVEPQGLQRVTPVYTTPTSLPPVPQPTDLKPSIPIRPSQGMTSDDAQRLRAQIAHDRRVGLCRTGIVPLEDRSYAVLLDNTVSTRVRQAAIYSAQEWQEQREMICTQVLAPATNHPARQQLRQLLVTRGGGR